MTKFSSHPRHRPLQGLQGAKAGRLQATLELLGEQDVRQLALPVASPGISPRRLASAEGRLGFVERLAMIEMEAYT